MENLYERRSSVMKSDLNDIRMRWTAPQQPLPRRASSMMMRIPSSTNVSNTSSPSNAPVKVPNGTSRREPRPDPNANWNIGVGKYDKNGELNTCAYACDGISCYVSTTYQPHPEQADSTLVPVYRGLFEVALVSSHKMTLCHMLSHYLEPICEPAGLPGVTWQNEGVCFYVYTHPAEDRVPLYHLYRRKNSDHFYTACEEEREYLKETLEFADEDVTGYVYVDEGIALRHGFTPLYRTFNPTYADHMCMTDIRELDNLGPKLKASDLAKLISESLVLSNDCFIHTPDPMYLCPTREVAQIVIDKARLFATSSNDAIGMVATDPPSSPTGASSTDGCDSDIAQILKSAFVMQSHIRGYARRTLPYAACELVGTLSDGCTRAMNAVVISDGKYFYVKLVDASRADCQFIPLGQNREYIKDIYMVKF